MKKIITFLTLLITLLIASPAYADYGAAQPTTTLFVNKTVFSPQANSFVDNITVDKQAFLPGQEVLFRITVKNSIQSNLSNVQVTDQLPSVLTFVSGPGKLDSNNNLTFTIDSLDVNEEKVFEIRT